MPPPVRWRATTLQSFARHDYRTYLKSTRCLSRRYGGDAHSGRVAAPRRYSTASSATIHHDDTPIKQNDTLEKGVIRENATLVDIIYKTQSTLEAIQQLRNEDSKAVDQFSAACEYLLPSETEEDKRIRISVYGSDESSAASNLITALLDDPLSSDESLRQFIGDRLLGGNSGSLGAPNRFSADEFSTDSTRLPSSFFSRFESSVVLEDLSTQTPNRLASILVSDIPIFVYSPFTPTQSAMNFFHRNPNALLVVDGGLDPSAATAQAFCTRLASQLGCDPSRVLIVDSARALRGIEALRSASPGSAQAVAQYQEDVLAAQLPQFVALLTETATRGKDALRDDAARALARQVGTVGRATVQLRSRDTDFVRAEVSAMQEAILETRERVLVEIFGEDEEVVSASEPEAVKEKVRGPVGKGVENVTKELRPVLDGLKWWRLPFAVDELSRTVDHAVERAYAKEFEKPLVFHTGRLAHLQTSLTSRTNTFIATLPPSFHSPLLQNTLAQLRTHPSFALHASALLTPIETRTAQLAHATRALHLSAQRAVLGTFLTSAVSGAGAYALWVTQALGTVEVPTAAAAAALGTLAGVRWGVGMWARARGLWLADCSRVGEGFERDVRKGVERVWERQVAVVPTEACRFLNEAVEKKREGVGLVEDAIEELEGMAKQDVEASSPHTSADGK